MANIPQSTIDQILDRTDIVDLIGQHVKLKKTGRTYSGCCPFHQEKSPSFHVYRDKGYYHCFGCQANGNAITFLKEIEGRGFVDIVNDLAQRTGIEIPKDDSPKQRITYQRNAITKPTPKKKTEVKLQPSNLNTFDHDPFEMASEHEQDQFLHDLEHDFSHDTLIVKEESEEKERSIYDLLEEVTLWYEQQLSQSLTAQNYFQQRHLSASTIKRWRLGYAPSDWQHLHKAFPKDIQGLEMLGLIRISEKGKSFNLLRDRVIFPIRNARGKVVGFGGRALDNDIKPKYINSPDSEVFHKNKLLYGLYEGQEAKAEDWIMVEGYMDVIALHQHGIHGAVATLGTASNADHLLTLFKKNKDVSVSGIQKNEKKQIVTLAFDGDEAGQKAAWRTLEIALPILEDGLSLKFFILPNNDDPDSLIQKSGVNKFRELLQSSQELSQFLLTQLCKNHNISTPEGKSAVMADLNKIINLLPQKNTFKWSLRQFFSEYLWPKKTWLPKLTENLNPNNYAESAVSREEILIKFLLEYPFMYRKFELLRPYFNQKTSSLLKTFFEILDENFDDLPSGDEHCRFFLLGVCYPIAAQLEKLCNQLNLNILGDTIPENLERHAEFLFNTLKVNMLNELLQNTQARTLKRQNELKKDLLDVQRVVSETQF